jgi:hypothetical protein
LHIAIVSAWPVHAEDETPAIALPHAAPPAAAADVFLALLALLAEQQPSAPATFIDLAPALEAVTAVTVEAEPPHPSWDAAVASIVCAEQPDDDAVVAADAVFLLAQLPAPAVFAE